MKTKYLAVNWISKTGEATTMHGFSQPKELRETLSCARKLIREETGYCHCMFYAIPGNRLLRAAFIGTKLIGWIELQEVK